MRIIAHRGLLEGPNKALENYHLAIDDTLKLGFDAEIDVWYIKEKWFLGHDVPAYPISFRWLRKRTKQLWVHCKNLEAANNMAQRRGVFNSFFHNVDKVVITTKGYLWTFPEEPLHSRSICVMPETFMLLTFPEECVTLNCYGICTDYPIRVKEILANINKV